MGEPVAFVGRRGVLKGRMTRILSYTQGDRRSLEVNQIKSRKDRLKELFDAFEEVQSAIEEESGVSEESENYRVEVEDIYYKAMANCEKIIKEEEPEQSSNHSCINNENCNNSSVSSNQVPSVKSFTSFIQVKIFWYFWIVLEMDCLISARSNTSCKNLLSNFKRVSSVIWCTPRLSLRTSSFFIIYK